MSADFPIQKKKNHFEQEGWLKCHPSNSTLTKQEKRGFENKNKTLDLEIFRIEAQITKCRREIQCKVWRERFVLIRGTNLDWNFGQQS